MARTIKFSGFEWDIKESGTRVGPGPNFFSGSEEDICVDGEGLLRLRTSKRNGEWHSTEAVLSEPLGYGTYEYRVRTPLSELDGQAVFSGFIYEDDYHELDIEFSRYMVGRGGAQFVVQPGILPGHIKRFDAPSSGSLHRIAWTPHGASFESGPLGGPGAAWTSGSRRWMPSPRKARFIFNLWLYRGKAPSKEDEVIVESFSFAPYIDTYL